MQISRISTGVGLTQEGGSSSRCFGEKTPVMSTDSVSDVRSGI